ncbi:MAG TPA: hypothetical protein VJJ80_01375 [Patescibacteria group bacterium]|nr:hypothetical protein [Patescibacteria group bacterium]
MAEYRQKIKEIIDYPVKTYQGWQYKNTTLLVISIFLLFYFAESDLIKNIIEKIGEMGYFGAVITGMFFVSTFTVAPAMVILYNLADILNPFEVAILTGTGAVIGDYLIFRFFKDKIFGELKPFFEKIKGSYLFKIFNTPYFAWFTPLIGAAIIASPMPDEMGIGILGISKMKNWQFLLLSFFLNATGIFIIVTIARSF